MKYRKKPVIVDAIPVKAVADQNWRTIIRNDIQLPDWVVDAYINDTLNVERGRVIVKTLEGQLLAQPDDMLIRGVKGELYPCKPDIFAATYEPVPETTE